MRFNNHILTKGQVYDGDQNVSVTILITSFKKFK